MRLNQAHLLRTLAFSTGLGVSERALICAEHEKPAFAYGEAVVAPYANFDGRLSAFFVLSTFLSHCRGDPCVGTLQSFRSLSSHDIQRYKMSSIQWLMSLASPFLYSSSRIP